MDAIPESCSRPAPQGRSDCDKNVEAFAGIPSGIKTVEVIVQSSRLIMHS